MKRHLALLLLLLPLMASGQTAREKRLNDVNAIGSEQMKKFTQFYIYLAGSYVDSLDLPLITEDAIRSVLADLDPHSSYITAEEMKSVKESFEGNFSGIGVQILMVGDTLHISSIVAGSPSERVGVLPNDRIVAVNDTSVVGMDSQDIVGRLRGPKGTAVNIEVVRLGESEKLQFRIMRDEIPITTVDAAYKPDATTGYIRVNRFANTTMKEMEKAFRSFGNIDALILDLRGNGGGLLGQSVDMAGFFLPKDTEIVSMEGRMAPPQNHKVKKDGAFLKGKVVVLVNEFSASASEIVAGALQDWDRAVIVGQRTYGKGLVQRQFPLVDGSAVNITVARYLTPTGRAIQRPFERGNSKSYEEDFLRRLMGSGADSLSLGQADSLPQEIQRPDADGRQEAAIADSTGNMEVYRTLRLGRTVYGGGGITPDYTVERDATHSLAYHNALYRQGVFSEYVSAYLDENRRNIMRDYRNFDKFNTEFQIDRQMIDELAELGERRGVPRNEQGMSTSGDHIRTRLKALIAQYIWSASEANRIFNEHDNTYLKAIEIIRNWEAEADGIALDAK